MELEKRRDARLGRFLRPLEAVASQAHLERLAVTAIERVVVRLTRIVPEEVPVGTAAAVAPESDRQQGDQEGDPVPVEPGPGTHRGPGGGGPTYSQWPRAPSSSSISCLIASSIGAWLPLAPAVTVMSSSSILNSTSTPPFGLPFDPR